MLVVISDAKFFNGEAAIINALFDSGMSVFHIRKPDGEINQLTHLLKNIKTQHFHKIALHQHHVLAPVFNIKRLHFTEQKRKEISTNELAQLKQNNCILSTSIHKIEDYKSLSNCFYYVFFGPVFNSISKKGYQSTIKKDFNFQIDKDGAKAIAIGGISAEKLNTVKQMQFNGVAALGQIWERPNEAVHQFKLLEKAWEETNF